MENAMNHLSYSDNTIVLDGLSTQGAGVSEITMLGCLGLFQLTQIINFNHIEWPNISFFIDSLNSDSYGFVNDEISILFR